MVRTNHAASAFFPECCHVLAAISRHAPHFPDVSRHVTAVAANLVTSLIDCAKANPGVSDPVMSCLLGLQKNYFGAVGPAVKHLEKFVLDNLVKY
jgi:hypothetical protein